MKSVDQPPGGRMLLTVCAFFFSTQKCEHEKSADRALFIISHRAKLQMRS